ncbi:MAG TPA: DUF362 domain-containing protein [Anaerolineae bacterium]|nr:DUF362 domain-containing protein [Anaerolineae bacterium]
MASKSGNDHKLTRRDFLRTAGLATAGALMAGCGKQSPPEPTAAPTVAAPSLAPMPATVAIAQADNYDAKVVYDRLRTMVDGLGGLSDVVKSGDRVAIKINMTGGIYWEGKVQGLPGVDTFITHPEVVRALGQLALDAGAKELYIVEAANQWDSFAVWGYEQVAEDLGATLIDLNDTKPYKDFVTVKVPGGGVVYQEFEFNPLLTEIDVFMSVSKMKCHNICGVTHTMKNLVGLVPLQHYERKKGDGYRTMLHGPDEKSAGYRMPRIIVELNKARPLHFGVVDGIKTAEGGEGPWIQGMNAVEPHVLIAGKNVVATDAVATAAMAFDPTAASMTAPFIRADNHLQLAYEAGLGTNRLEDITIVGEAIETIKHSFKVSV